MEFTEHQIEDFAQRVEDELEAIRSRTSTLESIPSREIDLPQVAAVAPEQQEAIEKASGEKLETFWEKYKRHIRKDICLPTGRLNQQWKKWKDLPSQDAVQVTLGVLAGMGIATANIPALVVPVTVFLITNLAHIGLEAFCEGCGEDGRDEKKDEPAEKAEKPQDAPASETP